MALLPIFPSVTSRWVDDWILSFLRSPVYKNTYGLFLSQVPPWIFINYEGLRNTSGSGQYQIMVVSAIVHEFVHLLQFVFWDRCSKGQSQRNWNMTYEHLPATVQGTIIYLLMPEIRQRYGWLEYCRLCVDMCEKTVREIVATRAAMEGKTK